MTALACLCMLGGAASLAQIGNALAALIRIILEAP
jgi:hypothetical protein